MRQIHREAAVHEAEPVPVRVVAAMMFAVTLVVWVGLLMLGWAYAGPRRLIRRLRTRGS